LYRDLQQIDERVRELDQEIAAIARERGSNRSRQQDGSGRLGDAAPRNEL
jgi:hypothetical protein